ncbi:methylamine utilization protein [Hyphomonas sp.]|uniref:methylamine utilization protein n=1 Tax=Hyphomonas sp. TaxID=87 RepID=UPI003F716CA7
MRILLSLLAISLLGLPAFAHDLQLAVVDAAGEPVAHAVVLVPASKDLQAPRSFAWPSVMEQKNIQFSPYILVAPVGSEVQFPNRDRVRHHVYSFSKGNRFELKLYGREETRSIAFSAPGIVAVGCNIHDNMIGYIRIVDTPFAVRTGADGKAVLTDLPTSTGNVTVWHPDLSGGEDVITAFDTRLSQLKITMSGSLANSSRTPH